MNVQVKGKGFNVILPKCDVMTCMMFVIVYDAFYVIVHDISKVA